jgi:hypothetical protein
MKPSLSVYAARMAGVTLSKNRPFGGSQLLHSSVLYKACSTRSRRPSTGPVNQLADKILTLLLISLLSLLLPFGIAGLADEVTLVPLIIDNKVLPSSAKNFLTDPRVFDAEFYRKFNPQLKLADDDAAKREWTSRGAQACRRGSFLFYSRDYLNRYRDLAQGDASPRSNTSSLPDSMRAGSAPLMRIG